MLDAARDLIDETGTAEIALGEVATTAGVGRTTFYEYFSDRDDVIAALVEEELPQVVADLIESAPADLPTAERLAELAARTVEFVAEDRVFGVILHRAAGSFGKVAQSRIMKSHAGLSREMADLYMQGVSDGLFRPMSPPLAERLIQGAIMSAAKALIDEAVGPEDAVRDLKRFLLGGLGRETLLTGPGSGSTRSAEFTSR